MVKLGIQHLKNAKLVALQAKLSIQQQESVLQFARLTNLLILWQTSVKPNAQTAQS